MWTKLPGRRRRKLLAVFVALQFLIPAAGWAYTDITGHYTAAGWQMFSGR